MKNERGDEICLHKRIAVSTRVKCIRNSTTKHRLTAVAGNQQGWPRGIVVYQYTKKKSQKYPKTPKIPPNIPKINQSIVYCTPEIRSIPIFQLKYTVYPI